MALQNLKVAVIGLGSAGQAASLFLKRNGHNVEVFEKVAEPKPIGAGFLLQPTAFVVLKKLGIMESIFASGSRVHHLLGQTTAGRKVLDLDYRLLDQRLFGLGLYRGTIFTQLLEKMQEEDVPIRPGVEIVDYESVGSQVSSKTGSRPVALTTASGEQLGPYDLVVVAEGARSALRAKRHQKWFKCARHYRWGTLWSIVPDTTGIYHASGTLNQYFEGTAKMMGILPTGYRPHQEGQTPLVTMFWSLHRDQYDAWKQRDFEDWRSEVANMTPHVQPLLKEIRSRDQVTFATYYDVRMWPYHNPEEHNVVYIGDSAHAMSPVLGQGVNLALNDAWVLSESIKKQDKLTEALNRYSNTRSSTLYFYQTMSMLLNPWFQSSRIPGFAFTRDRLFASVGKISPFLQREMLLTQSGAKTGFLPTKKNQGINYKFWEES